MASSGVQTIIDQVTKTTEGACYLCVAGEGPGWWALQTDIQGNPALTSWCSYESPHLASVVETLSFEVQERRGVESWLRDWTWENDKTLLSVLITK